MGLIGASALPKGLFALMGLIGASALPKGLFALMGLIGASAPSFRPISTIETRCPLLEPGLGAGPL